MFAEENGLKGDPRLQAISQAIRVVPHFPKHGIMFQDITTLLLDHKAFKDTVDIFVDRYRDMHISVVAGIEARGFMFGPSIALGIGAKFVPLRKPRKLPGEVISEKYALEYGTDCLELHVGAVQPGERAIVIDDLVATGGTLSAGVKLLGDLQPLFGVGEGLSLFVYILFFFISLVMVQWMWSLLSTCFVERVGAQVVECACVIGVPDVKGQCRLIGKPLYVLVEPRKADKCY
ncbi:hypothetical protein VIGAN_02079700 [Vigna angularis var. angularis]|uniref:adenine phosphoribosyltransferase n=1 Tax=Vigna angularis var. angularis TaxID=157739 RepID=A0A0S3RC57_PHAAN|nr:hypothetical protein VIGAN_02079700 [Vigna angularis var. angularis]